MGRGQSTKEQSKIADRELQALELRKAGASYRAIGKKLGISEAQAFRDVAQGLETIAALQKDVAEDVKRLEEERLDALLLAVWPAARAGKEGAVDRALKIMERRAKLLGLDAPTKIAPTTPDGEKEYSAISDNDRDVIENILSKLSSIATSTSAAGVSGNPDA